MKNWIRLSPVKAMILASEPPVWVIENPRLDASALVGCPDIDPGMGIDPGPPPTHAWASIDPIVLLQ